MGIQNKKEGKVLSQENINKLLKGRQKSLNNFESKIFPVEKPTYSTGCAGMLALHPLGLATRLKMLTPKQMLQRLPIVFAQLKIGNLSENLLNEIRQVVYFLYWPKEISKKYKAI